MATYADASVPDLVGRDPRLVFVGINPGLWTAAVQTHFARPGNRFYPALQLAGIIDRTIDPATGLTDDDRVYWLARGLANTNLVNRATARADELHPDELRAGRARLEAFVERHRPRVVAVAGITAYRTAFAEPKASTGEQAHGIGPEGARARLWVVPNPSGLNAHDTVASLAAAYAEPARAAGLLPDAQLRARAPAPPGRDLSTVERTPGD
nr:mismatch-specific DNA-glycosylase [Microlunatus antarcticus]